MIIRVKNESLFSPFLFAKVFVLLIVHERSRGTIIKRIVIESFFKQEKLIPYMLKVVDAND